MVKLFSLKSPDEWATTKQACRDTYVVTCFLPSTIRIYNNYSPKWRWLVLDIYLAAFAASVNIQY